MHDTETRAQRCHDEPGTSRRADQSETIQLIRMNARSGPLSDDEVHPKIFHRGVENFFHGRLQAMDFVEKEKILRVERGEHRGEVTLFLQQRAGTDFYCRAHFSGENLRKRRFAKAGRAIQQNVVERFPASARGFDGDLQILFDAILTNIIRQFRRPDARFDARVIIELLARNDPVVRIVYVFWHFFQRSTERSSVLEITNFKAPSEVTPESEK